MSSLRIAAYFHRPLESSSACVLMCPHACVCVEVCASVCAPVCSCARAGRCRGAGRACEVQMRCHPVATSRVREEGGGAFDSKGVNWAVIVQEEGYDRMKQRDLVRFGAMHLDILCPKLRCAEFLLPPPLFFFFIFPPSLSWCLWISKLSSQAEPLKCNALSFCQPHTFSLSCAYILKTPFVGFIFAITLAFIFHRALGVVQYVSTFSVFPIFLRCRGL